MQKIISATLITFDVFVYVWYNDDIASTVPIVHNKYYLHILVFTQFFSILYITVNDVSVAK